MWTTLGVSLMNVLRLSAVDLQQQPVNAAEEKKASTRRWRVDGKWMAVDVVASRVGGRDPSVYFVPKSLLVAQELVIRLLMQLEAEELELELTSGLRMRMAEVRVW